MSVDGAFHKDIRRQKNASLRQTFVTITLLFLMIMNGRKSQN